MIDRHGMIAEIRQQHAGENSVFPMDSLWGFSEPELCAFFIFWAHKRTLGREPTHEEQSHYMYLLAAGRLSPSDVLATIRQGKARPDWPQILSGRN